MTTQGGARDGDARDDGRDAGDTNDELAGEDAKLRAMRSVWLSMRDEEPSSGGLAELMAAARGKAAEMAPPTSWWQRAVAGLRRPPVLAFATVMVLLGGAMVVARRVELARAPRASEVLRTSPDMPAGSTAMPPAAELSADDTRARREVDGDGPAKATSEETKRASEVPGGDATRTPPARVSPARPAANAQVTDERANAGDRPGDATSTVTAGALAAPTNGRAAGTKAPSTKAPAAATREGAPSTATPAGTTNEGPADSKPPPAPPRDDSKLDRAEPPTSATPPQDRSSSTPPALYRECEAAATRGDCAEVRRLVEQISTTDRRYRARVTRTSRIAKCLAE